MQLHSSPAASQLHSFPAACRSAASQLLKVSYTALLLQVKSVIQTSSCKSVTQPSCCKSSQMIVQVYGTNSTFCSSAVGTATACSVLQKPECATLKPSLSQSAAGKQRRVPVIPRHSVWCAPCRGYCYINSAVCLLYPGIQCGVRLAVGTVT